jgi:hypothetical protein
VWAAAQRESPAALCDAVVAQQGATEALIVQKLRALPP